MHVATGHPQNLHSDFSVIDHKRFNHHIRVLESSAKRKKKSAQERDLKMSCMEARRLISHWGFGWKVLDLIMLQAKHGINKHKGFQCPNDRLVRQYTYLPLSAVVNCSDDWDTKITSTDVSAFWSEVWIDTGTICSNHTAKLSVVNQQPWLGKTTSVRLQIF